MRGAAYVGHATVHEIETEPVDPRPGEVLVRVTYCGLCGTDLHIADGEMDARVRTPLVFRHEMSGTIDLVGDGVTGWSIGDQVTVMPLLWDGSCPACLDGNQHICQNLTFVGIDSPGAPQELWNVPASTLVSLPRSLDLHTAALVEPTAVAVHDVRRPELQAGDLTVVLGGGPIGTLIATVARHGGARVIVSEVDATRREAIASLGFEVVDPTAEDLGASVEARSGGSGASAYRPVQGARHPRDRGHPRRSSRGRPSARAISRLT